MSRRPSAIVNVWPALALAGLLLFGGRSWAASSAEKRAFAAAVKSFDGGWWDIAEKEFGGFAQKYPKSEYRPEAIFRQAQARYEQRNSKGAAELLSANLMQAGKLSDEYQFWLAEAWYQGSNYLAAAEAYALVVKNFPGSEHDAQAVYDEALSYSKLGDWPRTAELLNMPDTALQRAAQSDPTNQVAVNGVLLLGEAHLMQKNLRAAEKALGQLASASLAPAFEWRRQYLLCRVRLAAGQTEEALQGTTNLLALAASSGERELQAESAAFRAGILEQLNRPDDAISAYEMNLGADVPAERRKFALLKTVELAIQQNRPEDAAQRIERFLGQFPAEASADAVLIALGELHLKQYLTEGETNRVSNLPGTPSPATNHLQLALAQFDAVITNSPASPLVGKAYLDQGWCFWQSGGMAESQLAFEKAARALPFSEDKAIARFKWADAQYRQNDFSGALTNYNAVVEDFSSLPAVREKLLEPALYQVVRAAFEENDVAAATNAMAKLLEMYPNSFSCQSALLLVGQGIDRQKHPDEARSVFAKFEKRFPDSPLLPEVRLAIARTYERETNWAAAIGEYDGWVTNFAGRATLPEVQYRRAWANYQAGLQTNALALFSDLMAQYPTNQVAALARNWVADYYFRNGDFKSAEENYQLLFQKWPATNLTYQARMMAGRAAVGRLGFADAVGYFTVLINDVKCPPNLVAQALFAYGDATMRLEATDTNKPLANIEEAVRAFGKLQQLYPTNELSVLAWGRIGDCYLQLAAQDPKNYDSSAQAYQKVLDDARAGVSARSQAEVGLAMVLDKQARMKPDAEQTDARKLALEHYLSVVYEKNLRDGEKADPFWLKKAGIEAAKLAEELQMWEQAVKLYEYLRQLLPSLAPTLDGKILKAKGHLTSAQT